MCNTNTNTIFSIDYSQQSDAINWQTNASNPIDVVNSRLRLIPDDASTFFRRTLSSIDPNNNRLRIGFDMEIFRPVGSNDSSTDIVFEISQGSTIIGTGTVCVTEIDASQKAFFHLDRTFSYNNLNGDITIRINVPNGHENIIDLKDITIQDFNFCDDNLQMYFVFDQFFELSQTAKTVLVDLLEYKIDNQETLTTEFFQEQNGNQIDDSGQLLFADADIDGANRVQDDETPKSFNPFVKSFGLDYDNVNSYFGGLPTGVANGSNYGPGILNLGWQKPQILNELLQPKNGAFFVNIDFTKSLKIVMRVVMSNVSGENVYTNPFYYRDYVILFDAVKCDINFYYIDRLRGNAIVDQIFNGFLYGITDQEKEERLIECDESITYQGDVGTYEFLIDFGLDTGEAGIDYNSFGVPDKFTIEWNGQVITSGFVGNSSSDQQLINLGVPPSEINTGPGTAIGELTFIKNLPEPTQAIVRVEAPLSGTSWSLSGKCPTVNSNSPIEIGVGGCGVIPNTWTEVYVDTPSPANYYPTIGDVLYSDAGLTQPIDGKNDTYRIRIPTEPNPTILEVSIVVDENGVIVAINRCSVIGNEDAIFLKNEFINDCRTCWSLEIRVPENETRTVQIASSFAPGGQYSDGSCIGPIDGIFVISDATINNVEDGTILVLGIEGVQPAPFGSPTSTISVVVLDGPTVVDALNLERIHINSNC